MSKIRSGFLLLLLCAAVSLSAVSASGECAHDHATEKFIDAPTCTEPGIMGRFCTVCGEQIIDYATPVDPLGHDFQSVTIHAPTCTRSGMIVDKCSRCGLEGDTVTVPPTGHRAGIPMQVRFTEGSCTQEGGYEQVIRCSVCDAELERTFVSVGGGAGHSMGASYVVDEPTCQHEGLSAQDCTVCGYTEYSVLEKTAHVRGEGVNENQVYPTCLSSGTYDYVFYCTMCGGELERIDCSWKALGHDWGSWITVRRATALNDGEMKRVCSRNPAHVEVRKLILLQQINHTLKSPIGRLYSAGFFRSFLQKMEFPAEGGRNGCPLQEHRDAAEPGRTVAKSMNSAAKPKIIRLNDPLLP